MPPTLCESGVKYFIRSSLKESHCLKEKHYNMIYNVAMMVSFVVCVTGFLWYRYKGKRSVEEQRLRDRQKQMYIVGKLQKLAAIKNKNNLITNLPKF